MRHIFIFCIALLLSWSGAFAQDTVDKKEKLDSIEVRGRLVDSFTYEVVDKLALKLFR